MIPRTILLDNLALVISLLAIFLGFERRSRNSGDVSGTGSSVARYRAIGLDVIGTQTPASYWVGGVDGLALENGKRRLVCALCGGGMGDGLTSVSTMGAEAATGTTGTTGAAGVAVTGAATVAMAAAAMMRMVEVCMFACGI
jgi:hypothetical protein